MFSTPDHHKQVLNMRNTSSISYKNTPADHIWAHANLFTYIIINYTTPLLIFVPHSLDGVD